MSESINNKIKSFNNTKLGSIENDSKLLEVESITKDKVEKISSCKESKIEKLANNQICSKKFFLMRHYPCKHTLTDEQYARYKELSDKKLIVDLNEDERIELKELDRQRNIIEDSYEYSPELKSNLKAIFGDLEKNKSSEEKVIDTDKILVIYDGSEDAPIRMGQTARKLQEDYGLPAENIINTIDLKGGDKMLPSGTGLNYSSYDFEEAIRVIKENYGDDTDYENIIIIGNRSYAHAFQTHTCNMKEGSISDHIDDFVEHGYYGASWNESLDLIRDKSLLEVTPSNRDEIVEELESLYGKDFFEGINPTSFVQVQNFVNDYFLTDKNLKNKKILEKLFGENYSKEFGISEYKILEEYINENDLGNRDLFYELVSLYGKNNQKFYELLNLLSINNHELHIFGLRNILDNNLVNYSLEELEVFLKTSFINKSREEKIDIFELLYSYKEYDTWKSYLLMIKKFGDISYKELKIFDEKIIQDFYNVLKILTESDSVESNIFDNAVDKSLKQEGYTINRELYYFKNINDNYYKEGITINDLITNSGKTNVILANVGEGKSIELAKINNEINNNVDFNSYVSLFYSSKNYGKNNSLDEIKEKIISDIDTLKQNLYNKKIVLLFDGIDELSFEYKKEIKQFITNDLSKNGINIILGSRKVEYNEYSTDDYNSILFDELSEEETKKLIISRFKYQLNEGIPKGLHGYFLFKFEGHNESTIDFNRVIIAVEDFINNYKLEKSPLIIFFITKLLFHNKLDNIETKTELYEELVKVLLIEHNELSKFEFNKLYISELEYIAKLIYNSEEIDTEDDRDRKIALIENSNGNYKFIHNSFYEYFLARYFINNKEEVDGNTEILNLIKENNNDFDNFNEIIYFYIEMLVKNKDFKNLEKLLGENGLIKNDNYSYEGFFVGLKVIYNLEKLNKFISLEDYQNNKYLSASLQKYGEEIEFYHKMKKQYLNIFENIIEDYDSFIISGLQKFQKSIDYESNEYIQLFFNKIDIKSFNISQIIDLIGLGNDKFILNLLKDIKNDILNGKYVIGLESIISKIIDTSFSTFRSTIIGFLNDLIDKGYDLEYGEVYGKLIKNGTALVISESLNAGKKLYSINDLSYRDYYIDILEALLKNGRYSITEDIIKEINFLISKKDYDELGYICGTLLNNKNYFQVAIDFGNKLLKLGVKKEYLIMYIELLKLGESYKNELFEGLNLVLDDNQLEEFKEIYEYDIEYEDSKRYLENIIY